jgi:hypothetical protein
MLGSDGRLSHLLSALYTAFSHTDPAPRRQKAISLAVLIKMRKLSDTPREIATANLALGAFFFACQSCKYSKVSGPGKTKPIQVGDVQFWQGRRLVPHTSPDLHLADTVSIIFWDQKNRDKDCIQTHWKTRRLSRPHLGNHRSPCPRHPQLHQNNPSLQLS